MFIKSPLSGVGNFANLVKSLQEKQKIYVLCPERTRQAMYLTYKRNIEVRSHELCCLVKATSYAYSEGLSLVLVIQHAMRVRYIFIRGLSWIYHFFHTISQRNDFREKNFLDIKCAF
jgi:hypothetical protein